MPRPDGGGSAPQLFLLTSADDPLVCPRRVSLDNVDVVLIGRGEPEIVFKQAGVVRACEIRIPDSLSSRRHAEVAWSGQSWMLSDVGSKNGTIVDGRPVRARALEDGTVFEVGHTFFAFCGSMWQGKAPRTTDLERIEAARPGLASVLPSLSESFDELMRVARSKVPVVIQGESGTGKELAAGGLHALSGRRGRFVPVNCGAIPDNLVESMLLGHRRGAFSGAVSDQEGMARAAHEGTLFLDEIGDLPAAAQTAFLRVLQEGEVIPVGATRPTAVDFRVCAASHRQLEVLVSQGDFREDLLARLSGFTFTMPPVRERREDLGLFLRGLLPRLTDRPVRFEPQALRAMFAHSWPRNVRELERVLEAALALTDDDIISAGNLRLGTTSTGIESPTKSRRSAASGMSDDERRTELLKLLQKHDGNISAVARDMDKARLQIRRWLKRYNIDADSYRED